MDKNIQITDPDLLRELESARGNPAFPIVQRHLAETQRRRNEKAAKRSMMTPVQRRRDEMRDLIASTELKHEDRYHLHSVLALCALPYRRPPDGAIDFIREYGRSSLIVQAGYLKDPHTGKMIRQGLPYGPKARLLMLHICTMALRQNSPEIELAESMSAFIRDLGFQVTGGSQGTINLFKEQLHRLAAARMQIGLWIGEHTRTINSQPIEAFDIWLPRDPEQKMLWSTRLYLNRDFYSSLKDHALPVDIRAIRSFANSARKIDIILWLAYRLRNLKRAYTITWNNLRDQFGASVGRERKFKEDFREDLKAIKEVFPQLPAELTEKGLRLLPCAQETLFITPKKALSSNN
jgi:hypothetical protein